MRRYVILVAALSLLALSGCLTYPYGYGYNGYGGYGGYYGGNPYGSYGSPQYGSPYCPPPSGYSYDPYAQPYGYSYGSAPGVVVPAPAPPVVVEYPPVVENYQYSTANSEEQGRWRQLAREGRRHRYPNPTNSGSTEPQTNTDTTQSSTSGTATAPLPTESRRQAALQRQQELMGNRASQSDGVTKNSGAINSGALDQSQQARTDSRQQTGTWQSLQRNARAGAAQSQMQRQQPAGSSPASGQNPQVRQGSMRQFGGQAAASRMSAPAARPMMAGPANVTRGQMTQARPQAQAPAQARGATRSVKQVSQ